MDHSRRRANWNYGWRGFYFITINCSGKRKFFGEVELGKMNYSEMGMIAKNLWPLVTQQFPFIRIDEFQVMPDHFHVLVIINKNQHLDMKRVKEGQGGWAGSKSPMISNNLSRVIRWFKGKCTYECRQIDASFKWQSTFDDKIIRTREDYFNIRNYIRYNPMDWDIPN